MRVNYILASAFVFLISTPASYAATAQAILSPTSDKSQAHGTVTFEETGDGMKVTAEVENAAPGKHGFHIHQYASCSDDGKAAGDHFNPDGVKHGFLPQDGIQNVHAGDLGNIEVGEEGRGKLELTVPGLTLEGKYGILGKSVVMHEKVDAFTQPAGNAGSRVACGPILEMKSEK